MTDIAQFNRRNMPLAEQAADRAIHLSRRLGATQPDKLSLMMDLMAADGVNGNRPLDWERLLAFDDTNFLHDVGGVMRHMDRDTGKLGDHFLPRCARSEEAA